MCLFHDWEIIKEKIIQHYHNTEQGCKYWEEELQCKVCLKCGKIIDEISKQEERNKKNQQRREQRRQKAIEIYESKTRQEEMENCDGNR